MPVLVVRPAVFVLLAMCTLLLAGTLQPARAGDAATDDDKAKRRGAATEVYEPGVVLVKFRATGSGPAVGKVGSPRFDARGAAYGVYAVAPAFPAAQRLWATKRGEVKGVERLLRTYSVRFDEAHNPEAVAASLRALPEVEAAEPLRMLRVSLAEPAFYEPAEASLLAATPNDALYAQQSHLVRMNLPAAWDVVKADQGDVLIAVIDARTDWRHADLQANIWTNPGEVAGNGLDDDDNGFIDDINGWNFSSDSADPGSGPNLAVNGTHGTWVAGAATAITNNGVGIAGMAWNSAFMAINTANPTTDFLVSSNDVLSGYLYAVENGADIINVSLGGLGSCLFFEQDFIDFAYDNNVLVVSSAGNEGVNSDDTPSSPASCRHVLSVGATFKSSDGIATFSNYGLDVDTYAPGTAIDVTNTGGTYSQAQGTSFSSPLAAGLAAMVKTQHPDWTVDQIREQVRATADDIRSVNTATRLQGRIGKGRINALRAVTEATPSVRIIDSEIRDETGSSRVESGETATVRVALTNFLETASNLQMTLATTDSRITVVNPQATIASLAAGEVKEAEFTIQLGADLPLNLRTPLNINFSSGAYTDVDGFQVTVNNTVHDTGVMQVTLTEEGNLGYEEFQGDSFGDGIRYQGIDWLFEGGLIMGTGPTKVSDNVRGIGAAISDDFVREDASPFGIADGEVATEQGYLQLLDSEAGSPLNVRVYQNSYADTSQANNDFVILRYTVENISAAAITNYHLGLFFDWDSIEDPGADFARYDAARRLGIWQTVASGEGTYIGTKALNAQAAFGFRAIHNPDEIYDDFTDAEKWGFISGGVQTTALDVTDVSTLMSAGPFTIGVGALVDFGFAIVGGSTEAEVRANADAAQVFWDDRVRVLDANPVANEEQPARPAYTFALEPAFPNPVAEEATIRYQLPAAGAATLRIHDILGREVRTLVDAVQPAGTHAATWDGADDAGRRLSSGLYLYTLEAQTPEGVRTATRKMVIVR
ncbi:MAG: S8 family serine peptidase [Rhodothermales bacterium]|nr:S8 family serine peptidase [Rhodothermales bacterium]